jgi:hypothetical protein
MRPPRIKREPLLMLPDEHAFHAFIQLEHGFLLSTASSGLGLSRRTAA